MKLEILLSCMCQNELELVKKSNISGNVVIINQCDRTEYEAYDNRHGLIRVFRTTQRGLTKSRNMAIQKSCGDVCMLCDDDEVFTEHYEKKIIHAYQKLTDADVIIFKMVNRESSFRNKVIRLRFPQTMKVSSWQISFKKESLIKNQIQFDELLGAGTGNGAEEELKFLLDCEKAGLKIYYVPVAIASVEQKKSTWFAGYTEQFFYNRGATTRYILGSFPAFLYAIYYIFTKKRMYSSDISPINALKAVIRGIVENRISQQAKMINK